MEVLFRARKKHDNPVLTGGKIYNIYHNRYCYCTLDDNGDEYRITTDKTLNETWDILKSDSEEDKFRERLLNS